MHRRGITGNIQPGKTPVAYDKLIDNSIYKDAVALVDKSKERGRVVSAGWTPPADASFVCMQTITATIVRICPPADNHSGHLALR